MTLRRFAIAMLCLAIPTAAAAQNAPAPKVKPGQHRWVITDTGREVEGEIDHVTATDIVIDTEDGLRTLPLSMIRRVEKPDAVWNGAIYGAATTLGIVVVGTAIWHNNPCVPASAGATCPTEPSPSAGQVISTTLKLMSLGAGIGALIDAIIPGRDVVWEQPGKASLTIAPIATLHSVGFNGQVRW